MEIVCMPFPDRLSTLRKSKGYTQQVLSDLTDISVIQLCRYEKGHSQPTLDVIKKLAIALSVSSDSLIFDGDERNPSDDLRLQFEAIEQFTPEEKAVAKSVIEGLILKHDAQRFTKQKVPG